MKIVIDTNVLVSAVLRDRDPETVILYVVSNPDMEWLVTPAILKEYKNVLARPKFKIPKDILNQWTDLIKSGTVNIESADPVIIFPRDRKDAVFLECALAGQADFLITGDRDFEEAQKLITTSIISLSLFRKLIICREFND